MTKYRSVTNCSRYAIKIDGCKCIPNIVAYGMQCTFCYKHKEKLVRFKWILWDVENPTNEELENVTRHAKSLFNNKEMKKSMITDEQGREWLLQKFYDDGWLYLFEDYCGNVWATKERPRANKFGENEIVGSFSAITNIKKLLPKTNLNQYLSIAEELGIVDWSKVPVDTPVLVRSCKESEWKKRYFAFYKAGKAHTWDSGATSWSKERIENTSWWNYIKLAEV